MKKLVMTIMMPMLAIPLFVITQTRDYFPGTTHLQEKSTAEDPVKISMPEYRWLKLRVRKPPTFFPGTPATRGSSSTKVKITYEKGAYHADAAILLCELNYQSVRTLSTVECEFEGPTGEIITIWNTDAALQGHGVLRLYLVEYGNTENILLTFLKSGIVENIISNVLEVPIAAGQYAEDKLETELGPSFIGDGIDKDENWLFKIESLRSLDTLRAALTDNDWTVRQAGVTALGRLNDPHAIESLIAVALRDGHASIRQAAVKVLRSVSDLRKVECFITALKDKKHFVRSEAAWALGETKDPRAVGPFLVALKDDFSTVRSAAVHALGDLKDPRAFEPLLVALKDSVEYVRNAAVEALESFSDPRKVVPLIDMLKDENTSVRRSVARALGELHDQRAVEPLIKALTDKDAYVRQHALLSLSKLTGQAYGNDPKRWQKNKANK